MTYPTEIKTTQLSRLIGMPNAPILIDVRIDEDFEKDPQLIPLSIRCAFTDIASLAPQLEGNRVVIYCQKGKKISHGAAAILRNLGIHAEVLEGGHFAWRDAGELLLSADKLPKTNSKGQSVWVTRQRPKVDRIACPWLIRRFIDKDAQFLFVPPSEVLAVAEKFDAIPFDIPDVFWSHRQDLCTFDIMVEEFDLNIKPIKRLAKIVRGADTNRHDIAPQAAGLLAASLGLSRMYKDDLAQLDAGMMLYDFFFRWSRDASDEEHDTGLQHSQKDLD